MPLTLICRRCSSHVQTDDRFCQECGLVLQAAGAVDSSNDSSVIPQSGNNFDFSPSEDRKFEWPALAEDPASANGKSFSTPAMERKFSRYNRDGSLKPAPFDAEEESFQAEQETASEPRQANESTSCDAGSNATGTVTNVSTPVSPEVTVAAEPTLAHGEESKTPCTTVAATLDTSAANASASATASDTAAPAIKRLHSPLLEKETAPKKTQTAEGGKHVFLMDAAAILAVLAFAVGLGYWGYNNYSKSELARETKLAKQAQTSSQNNELLATYKSLFALSILSQKGLDANQQASFDDAAFRLGQEAYNAERMTEAQDYLKNVSSSSSNYLKAQELIQKSAQNNNASAEPDRKASGESLRTERTRRQTIPFSNTSNRQLSDRKVLSIPVLPELESNPNNGTEEASKATTSSEDSTSTGNGLVIEMSGDTSATSGEPTASTTTSGGGVLSFSPENAIRQEQPKRQKRHVASAVSRNSTDNQSSTASKAEPPTPKFSESEISVYNRLLGKFIATHGQKSAQSEPPAFKEWIRQGKPAF